jgi:NAD(P)-dependent dehydrogenase (short-subunit alcohol dehydrogenase family)
MIVLFTKAKFTAQIPTLKWNTTEHIADLVQFLCLSAASGQMTGANYLIDQGYTAQ